MAPQPSRLQLDESPGRSVKAVGIIDSHTADELLAHLRNLGTDNDVRLDLTDIEFIDSSGLRSIVTAHQELEEAGRRLVLSGLSESVQRLLEITGLTDHLNID